ncbi:hypothetical protein BB560_002844 [Smittium megazygosporum]|uniref:Roadblock/LAMTOR2 domain-containing protein n=1 Tax=Smittium megazygosporum TaxID=133381 RepID=A0A2T9ZDR8_9FUNG|nr:hypothetical protein BB560_002844 [Smittium megazygosporum]
MGSIIHSTFSNEETLVKAKPLRKILELSSEIFETNETGTEGHERRKSEFELGVSPKKPNLNNSEAASNMISEPLNSIAESNFKLINIPDNKLQFLRLKSKQYEILICPSDEYVLVTYQIPQRE